MHTYVFYHRRSNDDSPRSYIEMTRVECRPSFRHVRAIHAVASMNRVRRTLSARYARNSRRLKANRYRRTSLDAPCLPRLVLHMQAPTFSPFFYFPFPRLSSLSLSHSLFSPSPRHSQSSNRFDLALLEYVRFDDDASSRDYVNCGPIRRPIMSLKLNKILARFRSSSVPLPLRFRD